MMGNIVKFSTKMYLNEKLLPTFVRLMARLSLCQFKAINFVCRWGLKDRYKKRNIRFHYFSFLSKDFGWYMWMVTLYELRSETDGQFLVILSVSRYQPNRFLEGETFTQFWAVSHISYIKYMNKGVFLTFKR